MDIHPLVIHYPISLLTVYALLELISVRYLQEKPYWFYVKAVFVILGSISAFATALAGEFATHFTRGDALAEYHLSFTYLATVISGFISILYILVWFGSRETALRVGRALFDRWIMIPLALACLMSAVLLGGFAGAMVYGTRFDPFLVPVFRLLNVY